MLYLHNTDIDHLYSFSTQSGSSGAFAPDSIRMKSSLGLAGKAFSSGKIQTDPALMIAEEKDLSKLKLKDIRNAAAVPIKKGT